MSDRIILLVEDNPVDEELTLRALKKARVVVARDGAEGARLSLRKRRLRRAGLHGDASARFAEFEPPKLGGLEVLRLLRETDKMKLLPVVILTSSREGRDLLAGYGLGANSYIVKPVDFTQFADAVRQLGLYWLVLNEPVPPAGDSEKDVS
ncbi:MAG TPA: response regulator [Gammaproteobacteria bacterium]